MTQSSGTYSVIIFYLNSYDINNYYKSYQKRVKFSFNNWNSNLNGIVYLQQNLISKMLVFFFVIRWINK